MKEKRQKEEEIEAIMLVPATPGGELTKLLQEADDSAREGTGQKRLKFIERGGEAVRDRLCRNNPWSKRNCEREDCISCTTGEKEWGKCKQEGVVYRIKCLKCEGDGTLSEYWGETARTAFERGEEHVRGMENREEKNCLWKHSQMHHQGKLQKGDLELKVVERHRTPLSRQVHEGVEIELNGAEIILNSKAEWNQSRLPRIVIETGDRLIEDEESGLGGREIEGRKKKLEMVKKKVEKRGISNEEKTESWEQYKRRKIAECEETGKRMESRTKSRKGRGKKKVERKMETGGLEEEGRLQEWLVKYGIDENPVFTEGEDKEGKVKKKEKILVERGAYKFTFYKTIESVAESSGEQCTQKVWSRGSQVRAGTPMLESRVGEEKEMRKPTETTPQHYGKWKIGRL